jgi:hypothetical protein
MFHHSKRESLSSNESSAPLLPRQWRETESQAKQRLVVSSQATRDEAGIQEVTSGEDIQSRQLKKAKGGAKKEKRKWEMSKGGGGDKGRRERPKTAPAVPPRAYPPKVTRTIQAIEGVSCSSSGIREDKKSSPRGGTTSGGKDNKKESRPRGKQKGKTKDLRTRGTMTGRKKDSRKRGKRLLVGEEDSNTVHCSFDELSLGDLDGQGQDLLSSCRGLVDVRAASNTRSILVTPTDLDCRQHHLQRRRSSRGFRNVGNKKSAMKRRSRSSGRRSQRRIPFLDCPDQALGIQQSNTEGRAAPSVRSDLYQRQLQKDIFVDDSLACMTLFFDPGVGLVDLGISGLTATNTASCTVSCIR